VGPAQPGIPGPSGLPGTLSIPEIYALARAQFEKTITLSQTLSVSRLRVEACWGLCRVFGYQGDLAQALQAAQEGLEVAVHAGDEWIAGLIRLAMGASFVLAARYEAGEEWLSRAALSFQECSDSFGLCASRLWLCLAWRRQKNDLRLSQTLPEVLAACRENGYDFLFTRPTLLGLPDERALIPLLLQAGERGWEAGFVSRLLEELGLSQVSLHPGYQLRVRTFGGFAVWRGSEPILQNGWRREKARQLFQLLLTFRQAPLDRDQISEHLWPGLDPAAAQRNFKVTLNTLYHVLEPLREAGRESAYIVREGTTYGLRPGADLWIDAEVFAQGIAQAESLFEGQPERAMQLLEEALALYGGEYLPEARYETWAAVEREHLAVQFLRAADRLSALLLQHGRFPETVRICQKILSFDNCWERAYQRLMLAYDRLGDHGQVARAYRRCRQALREELDVAPAPETDQLYHSLTGAKN
jgi:DNA-binding SARP family transcriptional activator